MTKRRSAFARALDKLLNKKNPDGSFKYSAKEVHALRSMLLLEIARRGEAEKLSEASQAELAMALHLIGITGQTSPEMVMPLVQKYYKGLGINPDIIAEFWDLLTMLTKGKDRVEAVGQTEKAYEKMTEKEAAKAPKEDDPVPEDSEHAQTLALTMGDKIRI